ncbi:efflux RND transporter periplasmic adaptor subunit [Crateriforma conspicua]|uniref:Macrolide transporter subunit MacA n=1 Tax=Crateriforma conspicua TaxID=2527996 RepID=A0A5C6FRB9_9PLAN|nr:HlyD family efflux transporter periplasmic adaptor subunit [Crateriforma conspicua]QDV65775.1 macrolide transporter subunit MacA [Crateriforma conspicua]TWU64891.1 macrolide transporter subunit MacA [Crateriforma conspicua]
MTNQPKASLLFLLPAMMACLLVVSSDASGQERGSLATPYAGLGGQRSMADGQLRSENGFVKFRRNIKIPAEVEGKLTQLNIEEGSTVKAGEIIGVIDDHSARLAVELKKAEKLEAKLNAENDINRRFAVSSRKLAEKEAEALRELFRKNVASRLEKEKKELEVEKAGLQIELADIETKGNQIKFIARSVELAMAEHELDRRQIKAPFDGVIEIEERDAQQGEWVQPGSPIASLLQMDELKVEADLPAIGTGDRVYAGAPCEVWVYADGKDGEPIRINAQLGFVSPGINSLESYRAWAVIKNQQVDGRWIIRPGMSADIVIK